MSNGEEESEVQPENVDVTGQEFGKVLTELKNPKKNSEVQPILDCLSVSPSKFLDTIAGNSEIPSGIIEAALNKFFGEGPLPQESSLQEYRNSSKERMGEISDAFSEDGIGTLKKGLKDFILQDESLGPFFMKLPELQQNILINNILEMQLMQKIGRQKFIQILNQSESGGHKYQALQEQVELLENIRDSRQKEFSSLVSQVYESGITEEKIPDYERFNQDLKEQITINHRRITALEDDIVKITIQSSRNNTTEGNKALTEEMKACRQTIRDAEENIKENEASIGKARERTANEKQRDVVEQKLVELGNKLAEKKGELREVEAEFSVAFNKFSEELETVFPEAAKDTLTELKKRIDEAKRTALKKQGEEMEKKGKEEGDIHDEASGVILKDLAARYIDTKIKWRGLRRRVVSKMKIGKLTLDFNGMTKNPFETCEKIVNEILNEPQNKEVQKNFRSTDARKKLTEKMQDQIFLEIVRNGVMHLKLDQRTLEALGTMPEFRAAASTKVKEADQEVKTMIEGLSGLSLEDKGGIKKLWEKMPLGGGIGAIMFLIAILGLGVGGKKLVGGE